jgi:hypothetical protein
VQGGLALKMIVRSFDESLPADKRQAFFSHTKKTAAGAG